MWAGGCRVSNFLLPLSVPYVGTNGRYFGWQPFRALPLSFPRASPTMSVMSLDVLLLHQHIFPTATVLVYLVPSNSILLAHEMCSINDLQTVNPKSRSTIHSGTTGPSQDIHFFGYMAEQLRVFGRGY